MTQLLEYPLHPELDADRAVADPEVDELLVGAIDLHTHPGPSPFPRRMTILDAARDAAGAGFKAIVTKSHHHSMQPEIIALRSAGLDEIGISVFGGIALNPTVGGLNPYAVELALRMGGRVVWFPTISSTAHIDHHQDNPQSKFPKSAIPLRPLPRLSVLDEAGELLPVVGDILDVIAEEQAILNVGHLGSAEVDILIPAARSAGVDRIVVSHPSFVIGASADRVGQWVRQGAKIEHCIAVMRRMELADILAYFDAAGYENTIVSSDFGQATNPLPVTGYRQTVRRLLDAGIDRDRIPQIVGITAGEILRRPGDPF